MRNHYPLHRHSLSARLVLLLPGPEVLDIVRCAKPASVGERGPPHANLIIGRWSLARSVVRPGLRHLPGL